MELQLLTHSLSFAINLWRRVLIDLLLQLLFPLRFLLSMHQDCLLLLDALNSHPLALVGLPQKALLVQRAGLAEYRLLALHLCLHFGHLLLHLRESLHLLLDLKLSGFLLEFVVLDLLLRSSSLC